MASILVVDADPADRLALASELRSQGHDVVEAAGAATAMQSLERRHPELVVLDWALPDIPGMDVLLEIKQGNGPGATRVLMTSSTPGDVVVALDSGADDFVGKPYELAEAIARIGACLRRPASTHTSETLRAGGITVDNIGHRVLADGDRLTLAPREYRLLEFLMANRDRVFSRSQLLIHVWDRNAGVGVRTVDVHIRRLRSLLEPYRYDSYVQTVRGSGYRFSPGS